MTPDHCRAARAWLNLSQYGLAAQAKVSLGTIRNFETGRSQINSNSKAAIEHAFRKSGIVLIYNPYPGLRVCPGTSGWIAQLSEHQSD